MWRERSLLGLIKPGENLTGGVAVSRGTDDATPLATESLWSRIVCCREGMLCWDWSRGMTFAAVKDSGPAHDTRFRGTSWLTTGASASCGHKSRCMPRHSLPACFITLGCRANTIYGKAAR